MKMYRFDSGSTHVRRNHLIKACFAALLLVSNFVLATAQDAVQWTTVNGCSVSGNNLIKTASNGWGNAGAESTNTLQPFTDGSILYTISTTTTGDFFYGFSNLNVNDEFYTIGYAFHRTNGTLTYVRLGGTSVYMFHVAVNDVLEIKRSGTDILFKRNGSTLYTASNVSTASMVVDASIFTNGGEISDLQVSFPPAPIDLITWANLTGVSQTDAQTLTKTATSGYGNAGATSQNVLYDGEDGWIEFTLDAWNMNRSFGFSDQTQDNSENSIDFAFHTSGNQVYVYENSVSHGNVVGVALGDKFRISRIGNVIYWQKNGFVVYQVAETYRGSFVVNVALGTSGAILFNSRCSFSVPTQNPGIVPKTKEFSILNDFYRAMGGDTWNYTPFPGVPVYQWPPLHNWPLQLYGVSDYGPNTCACESPGRVRFVDLRKTNIKGFIPKSFLELTDIFHLALDSNRIRGFQEFGPSESHRFDYLSLKYNEIYKLPEGFNLLIGEDVDLSHNYLRDLPASFGDGNYPLQVDLSFNRLEKLPDNLGDQWGGNTMIDISNNNLKELPYYFYSLGSVNCANNFLDFGTLESLVANLGLDPFQYAPQKTIADVSELTATVGSQLLIPARPVGANTTVLWEKKVGEDWVDVTLQNEDATGETFTISAPTEENSGSYRWSMTNSIVVGLTLTSAPIEVRVVTPLELTLDKFAFQYKYDGRKRITAKKVPGTGWTFLIYDRRDRLVFSQDANQRLANKWSYSVYDTLDRQVLTGIYTSDVFLTAEEMQAKVSTSKFSEKFDPLSINGYSQSVFSGSIFNGSFEVHMISFFDDYQFKTLLNNTAFDFEHGIIDGQGMPYDHADDLVTATKMRVLGSDEWLWNVTYYDDLLRPIQSIRTNMIGGIDRVTNAYDFVGKLLQTNLEHLEGNNATTISRAINYDLAGRTVDVSHRVGDGPAVVIQQNDYNKLGQLVKKSLGNPSGNFRQELSYGYNIRGWLKNINDVLNQGNNLFAMKLDYDGGRGAGRFNGNITEINWCGPDRNVQAFRYRYDEMNRLLKADYYHQDSVKNGRYNEILGQPGAESPYDLNGNIVRLQRTGQIAQQDAPHEYGLMDDLYYTYVGNKLSSVQDYSGVAEGFGDRTNGGDDYRYDPVGNMIVDFNKDITSIEYNHLNLPVKVVKGTGEYLTYRYDASGRKLEQHVFDQWDEEKKVTVYDGEFVYENDTLQFINHEEGRVVMTGASPEYQYHLKDHLGNVRVTITTKDETDAATATAETVNFEAEYSAFLGYANMRRVNSEIFDHTYDNSTPPNGSAYAIRLSGTESERIGLRKSLAVMPGDTIRAEVYGKYYQPPSVGGSSAFIILMQQIAQNAAPTGVVVDGAGYLSNSVTTLPPGAGLLDKGDPDEGPKAYLNWVVFDSEWNLQEDKSGFVKLSSAPLEDGSNVEHERLALPTDLIISSAGYVYIWLSNEGEVPVAVYWDDFKVEHVKSPVIQSNDYYPFGLTFNSCSRENSVPNKFKFQSQEHIDDLGLNWEAFKWRNHQPDIGRFFNVDPLASDFPQWSPYVFSGNMVTISKELEGMEPDFMIHGDNGIRGLDNRITKPMSSLLNAAFGFSPESISNTVWYRDDDPRAHWFTKKVVPDKAGAITWGRQVVYDHTNSNRDSRYWFTLIAHEQRHRDDVYDYGDFLFYGSYLLEAARVGGGHDDLQHEKLANTVDSYADKLWDYNGGEVQKIFNMDLPGSQSSRLMESVGARFRRDVILSDNISGAQSSISKINGALKGVTDKGIRSTLQGLINAYNKRIDDAKKEQDEITKQYGN